MTTKLEINIPFSGFYESIHSHRIDDHIEQDLEYAEEYPDEVDIEDLATFESTDFRKVYFYYARDYVAELADKTGLDISFEKLDSPKFYNYRTDDIYATITLEDAKKVVDYCVNQSRGLLKETIQKRHSHRSGFISSYSNDLNEWLNVETKNLDHNHLETFLIVYLQDHLGEDWQWHLMDDYQSNGGLDNIIYDNQK